MEQPTLIPLFIESKTKEGLVLKILENNLKNGMHYKYFSPLKDGKNWVVWYYANVEDTMTKLQLRNLNGRLK